MDFAYFLDISIKDYSKIEKKIRGADPALIDKINLVRESVYHLEAMGMLGQAANPTWTQGIYSNIQMKARDLVIQIIDMETWIKGRRKNALRKFSRNEMIAEQVNYLRSKNAPKYIIEKMAKMGMEKSKEMDYHSLDSVYLYEAKIAGKKAELAYLKELIASQGKDEEP